jgi:putative copper resistance protein D
MTDWGIVAARFLQFGPALVLFGTPLFCLYGFDAGPAHQQFPSLHVPRPALVAAGVLALAGAVWWVIAETAAIFSEPGQFGLNAIWTVLTGTGFGRAAFLRIALIGACLVTAIFLAPRMRPSTIQAVLGGAVVASFAWTGHGIEGEGMPGLIHLGADIIHLLAAAVWIGALLCLAFVILQSIRIRSEQNAEFAYHALKGFSGIGTAAVALLIFSGIVNGWFLVGPRHIGQLFTTAYGGLLIVKLVLFAAMLAFAAANRFRLNPQLGVALRNDETVNQPLVVLRRSILTETVLGLLVLVVVSWMGTLEPPMSGG